MNANNGYSIVDERCLAMPYLSHSYPDAYRTEVGSLATIHCNLGYRFQDGQQSHETMCVGHWNVDDSDNCAGRMHICAHCIR